VAIVTVRKCGACSREISGKFYEFRAVLALYGDALTQAEAVRECCSQACVEAVLAELVRKVKRRP
jgi:hypothetical protein